MTDRVAKKKINKYYEHRAIKPKAVATALLKEQNMSNELELNDDAEYKTTLKGGGKPIKFVKPAELADLKVKGTFTAIEESKFQKPVYVIESPSTIFKVNACGTLTKGINENCELGDEILLVYNGVSKIKDGAYKGRDAHLVEVRKK